MSVRKKNIFSLPLSPYLTLEEYENFYRPFVTAYKEFLYDIYVTIRLDPFSHDAMGGTFHDNETLLYQALKVQHDTDVPVSAVFNNTCISPSLENLDLFIQNFTPLYEAGITSITLPVMHWMFTGKIQQRFANLKIKNSVLQEVHNARQYWDSALAGYDVINLDRNILRDKETLLEIKKAQRHFLERYGHAPKTQILANEQCTGFCPVRSEHYNMNFQGNHYFGNPISTYSCSSWGKNDPAYDFKRANISPFREDIDEMLTLVDIFKLFGRDGKTMLKASMSLIESYVHNHSILPTFSRSLELEKKILIYSSIGENTSNLAVFNAGTVLFVIHLSLRLLN